MSHFVEVFDGSKYLTYVALPCMGVGTSSTLTSTFQLATDAFLHLEYHLVEEQQ